MRRGILCFIVALTTLGFANPGVALAGGGTYDAHLYAITQWTTTCSAGARDLWDDMGKAWYNEVTNSGFSFFGWCLWGHCDDYYNAARQWVDGAMSAAPFTDRTLFPAWGQDTSYVDIADAAMICTHGGDDGGYWRGKMRNTDGNGDCYINANTELRVGDWDLEFLHLSSCHSLDDNMIPNAYRVFSRAGSSRILHQLDGFHGCMWIGSSFIADYEDFADDAFDIPIGLSWMLNMYRTNVNGQWTQCPIAYAVGSSADDCINRLTGERYNNVYSDPSAVNYYCYYYYPNCAPDCETPFGQDWSN
ncbi:MAG TPA: DUF6345 domain-containing protein [Syntrophobacteraceae bacterium]|nr:DUF6345 domain-containing protein [Syntrophobacteraceae bacterium]